MRDDHPLEVVDAGHLARGANQELLAISLQVSGADVGVVAFQCFDHRAERQAKSEQLGGIGQDVKLLDVAARAVDLGDARYLAKLRSDNPVLDRAQCHRIVGRAVRLFRAGFGSYCVKEDFTEAGGNRPHLGFDVGRELVLDFLKALADPLPREVDVGAISEDHRHLRQAVTRRGARVVELWHPGHCCFDRKRDALLDLQRRVAGSYGIDLHLDIGDVRHRVYG